MQGAREAIVAELCMQAPFPTKGGSREDYGRSIQHISLLEMVMGIAGERRRRREPKENCLSLEHAFVTCMVGSCSRLYMSHRQKPDEGSEITC